MTPERIAELRAELSKGPVPVLCGQDLAGLLAKAMREAKLREDVARVIAEIDGHTHKGQVVNALRAALESKGGGVDNGGPAFPVADVAKTQCPGMTLRDYFAGQALAAIPHIGCGADLDMGDFALSAYQLADAMLAAREEGGAT